MPRQPATLSEVTVGSQAKGGDSNETRTKQVLLNLLDLFRENKFLQFQNI